MSALTALTVCCPLCQASLMDERQSIDNAPSIKLNVSFGDQRGVVRLSSVYGSPNLSASPAIPADTVTRFFCPACNGEIVGHTACSGCGAPLVSLPMEAGGSVSFCARRGCRKHLIEFEDLDLAMRLLHEESESVLAGPGAASPDRLRSARSNREAVHSILHSGTYLLTYCPHCHRSLLEDGAWKFSMVRRDGRKGDLRLSPFLNDFTHSTSLPMEEGAELADLRCFRCDRSLLKPGASCPQCRAGVSATLVAAPAKLLDFLICTRKGCRWHGLSAEDVASVKLEET